MYDSLSSQPPAGDYPVIYRNLMAVGLLGAIYRRGEDADTVNEAVELTLADPAQYRLCRSIAVGMGGDAGYAKGHLMARLDQHPGDDGSKVALAIALMFSGVPQWKHWLDNVLATSTDQAARDAAHGVLSYLSSLNRMH